jgi:hypothetical protein
MHILTAEDIDDDEYDDTIIWCPACLERGYNERIGPKILMPNEVKPDNYSDLWECGTCGLNGDISMIPKQEEIKNAIETSDNQYEDKTVIESVKRRKSKTGKPTIKRGGKRKKRELHHDTDINLEMKTHGDRVKILYDSNP